MVEVDVGGREIPVYLAEGPPGAPGVVVIQEYWGVVDQIKGVADRLAADGFTAAVPDLYGGKGSEDRDVAMQLMLSLDVDASLAALDGTIHWLRTAVGSGAVGSLGFCMGGGLAMLLTAGSCEPGAGVVFYGAIPWEGRPVRWQHGPPPLLLHYASEDPWALPSFGRQTAADATAAGGRVEMFEYAGAQHAFLDETRPESHDPAAAALAWDRTVGFLRRELAVRSHTEEREGPR
jgi:carboxymethylenebutenolidase